MQDSLEVISGILNNLSPEIAFDATRDCDVKLSDLGVDSLDNMSLFLEIQEQFALGEIPDADVEKLTTVNLIIAYVESRHSKAA